MSDATSLDRTIPNAIGTEDDEDSLQKHVSVWYACYGSNLLQARFNCYLRGGQVPGMSKPCVGARDPTLPSASFFNWVLYSVFFAYANESTWGFGGGVMFDLSSKHKDEENGVNKHRKSCMRLYRVTLQQFNDVVAQENGYHPPMPARNRLTRALLEEFRKGEEGSYRRMFDEGEYPAVGYLGDHDGLPILTFTCPTEDVEKFLSGEIPCAPPAKNYLKVLCKGLVEGGLSEEEAEEYWKQVIEAQFGSEHLPN